MDSHRMENRGISVYDFIIRGGMVKVNKKHDVFLQNLCPYIVWQSERIMQVAWLDMDRDMLAGQRELFKIGDVWIQICLN